jgi:hypothetical protein
MAQPAWQLPAALFAATICLLSPAFGAEPWPLSEIACRGKTYNRLGMPERFGIQGAVRFLGERDRYLVVPENQCRENSNVERGSSVLLMVHINEADEQHTAGYGFVTTPRGLLQAARILGRRGGVLDVSMTDTAEPTLRADFEAEHTYWLTKQSPVRSPQSR